MAIAAYNVLPKRFELFIIITEKIFPLLHISYYNTKHHTTPHHTAFDIIQPVICLIPARLASGNDVEVVLLS